MLEKIELTADDSIRVYDGIEDNVGCGSVNNDGLLYFINRPAGVAYRLPDKYKNTPMYICPHCGGYKDGLIMVSLFGNLDLQYHHRYHGLAGMWGWIDLDGNEIIPPQYVYALQFFEGRAVVCKGTWSVDENNSYWCDSEQWGLIDTKGNEIVPCMFDELDEIDNTERFLLCHAEGWDNGYYCIYDIKKAEVILKLDFDFDNGYMFNECFHNNGCIFFDEHIPGEETDYLYVYSVEECKWLCYHEEYKEREFNGETRMSVEKDGKEIIIF